MPLSKKILFSFAVCTAIILLQILPALLGDNQFGPIPGDQPRPVSRLYAPQSIRKPPWLEKRRRIQLDSAAYFSALNTFSFTDRIEESGIAFRNRITDDSGKRYLPVHYDHGCGLAAADIDGDGLIDLYLVNQAGGNKLWRNLGKGRFVDKTTPELALEDRICVSASFSDTDNDGDADLYVTSVRGGNVLFENDGRGGFADISARTGIDYRGHSSAAVFFDYNRDGLLDLFLTNVGQYTTEELLPVTTGNTASGQPGRGTYFSGLKDAFAGHLKPERTELSILYENKGNNRFVDVSEKVGLLDESWTGDAAPLDFNQDGWPDLYVLNMQGHDEYYENVEGKRFTRKSRQVFPKTPWGSMGIKAFDYDNDGDLDLFLTDMHSDMSENVGPCCASAHSGLFARELATFTVRESEIRRDFSRISSGKP